MSTHRRRLILAAVLLGAATAGCSHAAKPPAAPGVIAADRQTMIQWHQQHDRQPSAAAGVAK